MDLLQLGASLLRNKLGEGVDSNNLISALTGLLGDGEGGGLDLGGLVSRMMGDETAASFTDMVQSWLGDGENSPISIDQVKELFGGEKVAAFASALGTDEDAAAETIADTIPDLVDKSSSGGSLLDSLGGLEGVVNMAKKFF